MPETETVVISVSCEVSTEVSGISVTVVMQDADAVIIAAEVMSVTVTDAAGTVDTADDDASVTAVVLADGGAVTGSGSVSGAGSVS